VTSAVPSFVEEVVTSSGARLGWIVRIGQGSETEWTAVGVGDAHGVVYLSRERARRHLTGSVE
jgi:hypothetical protein